MASRVILPIVLSFPASLAYALYRAVRKWGVRVVMVVAGGVNLLGASGVLAERLFGPRWSWNFAHHGWVYAYCAFAQGVFLLGLGLGYRTWGPRTRP